MLIDLQLANRNARPEQWQLGRLGRCVFLAFSLHTLSTPQLMQDQMRRQLFQRLD